MRFSLNLITLSLLALSGNAMAMDFSVANANTSKIKEGAYQCKRCVVNEGYQGQVSATAHYLEQNDIHAGNAFGTDKDGLASSVSGDVHYQNKAGYQAAMQAHQVGLDNSFITLTGEKAGVFELALDYQLSTRYQADDARSQYWYQDGMLTPVSAPQYYQFDLLKQREVLGLAAEYQGSFYDAYASYQRQDKTGNREAVMFVQKPIAFGLPIDSTTDNMNLGMSFSGANWLADMQYNGSLYRNNIDSVSLPYAYDAYSATPDNEAHQVAFSGQYRLNATVMNGRVVVGRMIQDDDLVTVSNSPIQNWDGQVDTLDMHYGMSSMLSNRLRLGGSVDYSQRDNKGSQFDFMQYSYNNLSGAFKQNLPLDIDRTTVKVNASYRLMQGYRLQAGYERKMVDRNYGQREQTHDDKLWSKLAIRAIDDVTINLEAAYGIRGGSRFNANEVTSAEENPLLRKFYLADRNRAEVGMRINYSPLSWLAVDLNSYYADDEYDATQIGLKSSTDVGYDLNVSLQLSEQVNAYGFAGQQWIKSAQAGSQSAIKPDWFTDINDEFINLGAGLSYGGLLQDKLTLGADYLFANSASDADTYFGISADYGDYYSYSHSVNLYADYQVSSQFAVKLAYQYERYYDTDPAKVEIAQIPGLVTLGQFNHNYNAHQVMLSFSYQLQ